MIIRPFKMELFIPILSIIISSIIALISLFYVRARAKTFEQEIKKKRYLEKAQSNLTEAIAILREINFPAIINLSDDAWGDQYFNAYTIANDIIRASFELKTQKIELDISYSIRNYNIPPSTHDAKDQKRGESIIKDFDNLNSKWLINLFNTSRFFLESNLEIINYERNISNDIDFTLIKWNVRNLMKVRDKLLVYEEVYDSLSLDSAKRVNQLVEEIIEEIFNTINKPKKVQLNLDEFMKADAIIGYLLEEILNYTTITNKFSEVSQLVTDLGEIRKELFRKIM